MLQRSGLSIIGDILRHRRLSLFGHVARLDPGVSAHDALRPLVNTYECRKPIASWRRLPDRSRNVWLNKVQSDANALLLSMLWRSEIARGHGVAQRFIPTTPIYLIASSLCSTLLLGRLLDCDDQTTSLTLLQVFTGCVHLNASSLTLNWQSLSTEVFTALHLGICLICCTAFQTSHRDAVSGRQPPLNLSSLCRGL